MRAKRDTIFIITLVLALLASTGAALTAWASADSRQTVQINGGGSFTSGLNTTVSTNGTPAASATGASGAAGSGGAGANAGGAGASGSGSGNANSGGSVPLSHDTIKIGGIFSESGGIDATVEQDTVQACFQMYNAQGGINGHKLQLVSYDDGLNGDNAKAEAVKLDTSDHVMAIVGWLAPFGESSAAPYFEQQGIPIVGGLGVPEEFGSPYSFPVSPVFYTDGYLLGQYAAANLHFHHPGIFLTKTAGIEKVAEGIKAGAAAHGVTISDSDINYVPFAATNFQQTLLTMQANGVDGLITQLDPYSYVRLYSGMESNNHIFPHLAGAGMDKRSVDQAIGSPLVNVYSFMPYREAQGNPDGISEINLYNSTVARYYPGQVQYMDAFSEGSWVACRVFAQALAKLGPNVTRDGIAKALASGDFKVGGMSPELNYAATHGQNNASHCAVYITYTSSHQWRTAQGFTCA
ncbi:MAG TPA: ABC transporter substrate-binding protein [Ktedonobacterales bacterium]|jgi:branched-chain amino acid transport system substrate-binding protein|nr:ABC transporter substrate-binding protein [Ktedonobacterales bacterium]